MDETIDKSVPEYTLAFNEETGRDAEETQETTLADEPVDYTPVIQDVGMMLANIQLACALMIVGLLMAFKLWEVKHK